MSDYAKAIELIRQHKKDILDEKRRNYAESFMARCLDDQFNQDAEIKDIRTYEQAIKLADEVIDQAVEYLEKGAY